MRLIVRLIALGSMIGCPILGPAQVASPESASRSPAAQALLAIVESPAFAELRAADNERVAAFITADASRLDAILSNELHYAHSNGHVEDKAAFIAALTGRRAVYRSFEYTHHRFIPAGPGVTLMIGRALTNRISSI
jgi:hypothetical protein